MKSCVEMENGNEVGLGLGLEGFFSFRGSKNFCGHADWGWEYGRRELPSVELKSA
jgi:hypothetical protein